MEANFSGFVIDPAKCSQLSLEEKRELVHEISIWADNAPEILQSWTRRELLQIICAEIGKERKYTGLTKPRMIARLLKLMSERNTKKEKEEFSNDLDMPLLDNTNCKKKRKKEQLFLPTHDNMQLNNAEKFSNTMLCKNLACRASLNPEEAFCRRCSCCICYCYDENKDPSLWLICNSDPPYSSESCGISCHLTCILKHKKDSLITDNQAKLDGAYYCIICGKVNCLIGSWRKQLIIANEARRVDLLCQRISLSHKILKDSKQYKELHSLVDMAMVKLKKEVGPLDKVSDEMSRGIVKRLACAADIQKLCSLAVDAADSLLSGISKPMTFSSPNTQGLAICHMQFQDISPVSIVVSLDFMDDISEERVVGSRLWHRPSGPSSYSANPTCIMAWPDKSAIVSGLTPSTEYWFKASLLSSVKELGSFEACWTTQPTHRNDLSTSILENSHEHEDEEQDGTPMLSDSQRVSTNSSDNHRTPKPPRTHQKKCSKVLSLEDINHNDNVPFVCSNLDPLETPSKSAGLNSTPDAANKKESVECEYEYCVKVIRWLECEGHMEKDFRVKLLTWFSLKATLQERRVVKAFIDVLIDEPESLVDQLIDAFMDGICNKKNMALPKGLCTRLWH